MKIENKPIVILPARQKSKRIRNKNIIDFYGQPLILRTIKNLIDTKIFSKIFVSTDSEQIAKISKKNGAEALYPRPENLSNDKAVLLDVMAYELKKLKKSNLKFTNVFCILPTAIFINKQDIIRAKKKLSKNINYIITGIEENKSTLRNFYFYKEKMKMTAPKFINFRTQDLPNTYRDAGQLYLAHKNTWIKKKEIFSSKSKMILLDSKKYIDIDNYSDLKKAKKIYKHEKI